MLRRQVDKMKMTIAPGFSPHFRKSPLTDPWEPLYSKVTEDSVIIALVADTQHCNSRGFVHGGLISAIADNAMGLSCGRRHDDIEGLVTISLHVDFASAAKKGQWLEFHTEEYQVRKIDRYGAGAGPCGRQALRDDWCDIQCGAQIDINHNMQIIHLAGRCAIY